MHKRVNVLTFLIDPTQDGGYLSGGGNVTRNFVSRLREDGYDVMWYCVTPNKTKAPAHASDDYIVVTGSELDEGWRPRSCDKIVVYAGGWYPEKRSDWKNYQLDPERIDTAINREKTLLRSLDEPKTMAHIGHKLGSSERKLYQTFPEIIDLFDDVVCFGPGSELLSLYDSIDGVEDNRVRRKVRFVQHNTVSYARPEWTPVKDKNMLQFYWQGRADPTWKGWRDWIDFKELAHNRGIDFNLTFNGVSPTISNLIPLTSSMKPKIFLPYVEVIRTNKSTKIHFSNKVDDKSRFYGYYLRSEGIRLLNEAGFAMYTTKLPASMRFWPEYTTLEAIQQGTVLCVPSNYFDADGVFPNGDPEELALLPLPMDRTRLLSKKELAALSTEDREELDAKYEEDWARFADLYAKLSVDPDYYDEWRSRAFDVHIRNVDWVGKARMVVEGGSEL